VTFGTISIDASRRSEGTHVYGPGGRGRVNTHILELGAPVQITVAYAGQTPVPKPFLMIVDWVRTPEGWRMATDIALPIPPSPSPGK
jgi:hypothetical protein